MRINILSNLVSRGWAAVMAIAFMPLYLHFMGVEAYGLVGVYATLQSLSMLLDMGLSTTLSRELARYSTKPHHAQEMANLLRTLEVVYWGVGVCLGVGIVLLSPFIATQWLNPKHLSSGEITQTILIIAVVTTVQWPLSFYSGGLMGLQRFALLNVVNSIVATGRNVGAVLILWLVSPTAQAFFAWQIVTSLAQVVLIAAFLWKSLPPRPALPRFDTRLLWNIWHFAAGLSATSIVVLLLNQADKLILSRMLSLETFGYYSLATTVANVLFMFSAPASDAMFPRFSQYIANRDEALLKRDYHLGSQLLSALVLPGAVCLTLFSLPVFEIWTKNPITALNTAPLVSLLALSTVLMGLRGMPYAVQFAYGWVKLSLYANLVLLTVGTPILLVAAYLFGAMGVAGALIGLNLFYLIITQSVMHRRLLPGEGGYWWAVDVGLSLAIALLILGLGWAVLGIGNHNALIRVVVAGTLTVLSTGLTIFVSPALRPLSLDLVRHLWHSFAYRDTHRSKAPLDV